MNDDVLTCLKRYQYGELVEIIDQIDFYKGQWKFTFKTPAGFKSWRQWLYLNEKYPEMNSLLRTLAKTDYYDPYHIFEDSEGREFARINDDEAWKVIYSK